MTAKVALVTGARTGVGLELTRKLLRDGWEVIALIRSPMLQTDDIRSAEAAGRLRSYFADMADRSDLDRAIAEIRRKEPRIDVLFNNAGVSTEKRENSPQGRELHFEVNVLAPYVLARAMLPLLERGTMRRIVNTSSNALLSVKTLDVELLTDPPGFRKLLGPYASSKLALSLWTQAAAPEFAAHGVTLLSVCPGANRTPMTGGAGMPLFLRPLVPVLFKHPSRGAETLINTALTKGTASGSFVMKGGVRPLPFSERAVDVLAFVDQLAQDENQLQRVS